MRRRVGAMGLALLLLGAEAAAEPVRAGSQPDPPAPEVDWPLYLEAQEALAAAGVPLTREEGALLGVPTSAGGDRPGSGWIGGDAGFRTGWSATGFQPAILTVRLQGPGFKFKLRRGRSGDLAEPVRAAGETTVAGMRLLGGGVGHGHGYGLLMGAAGRRGALGADQSLMMARPRWRLWPYRPEPAAPVGLGLGWSGLGLDVQGLLGTAGSGTVMLRLERQDPAGGHREAVLLLETPEVRGLSLSLRRGAGPVEICGEAAAAGVSGRPAAAACVLAAGWDLGGGHRLEGQLGWARGGCPAGPAARPPVLLGWDGRGWAVRARLRPAAGVGLKVLAGGAADDRPDEGWVQNNRRLREVLGSWTPAAGWRWEARWRRRQEWAAVRSARYPWLAASKQGRQTRTLVSVRVVRRRRWGRIQAEWRSLEIGGAESGGTRSLASAVLVRSFGPRWSLRATWTDAWGDPVDLVSAVCPLGGYVLPRHWGSWGQEQALGLGWERGPLLLQVAGSVRTSAAGDLHRPQGWASGMWRF